MPPAYRRSVVPFGNPRPLRPNLDRTAFNAQQDPAPLIGAENMPRAHEPKRVRVRMTIGVLSDGKQRNGCLGRRIQRGLLVTAAVVCHLDDHEGATHSTRAQEVSLRGSPQIAQEQRAR